MPRISDRAGALQESAIRKLDITVRQQRDARFYRINIGQPDVPTPEAMLDAIGSWRPDCIAYGPASGTPECREAGARYHSAWCSGLTAEHVVLTTGGSEALLFAFTAMCDPGDEILVPEPYYTNYNGFATVAGASVKAIRTRLEDGFALPSDAELDAAWTPRTRALVFSNPCNPTGAIYSRAEVERVIRWCMARGIWVVADEVYRRIWFDAPPVSALELDWAAEHVVVIDSMSKTWSACGLRLGMLISRNEALMEKIERLGQARLGPQPLAQHAAMAALALPESYYAELRGIWRDRVAVMADALAALPGVESHRPAGAFYTMARLPVDDADAFARFLVTDFRSNGESVVVAPGGGFYADPASGRCEIRLAAVLEPVKLRRAVEILGEGLAAYPGCRR
jgi:aspartate aminotransferase